jgi:hypothetical protein
MRYKLATTIHRLDGTTVEEKDDEPRSKLKLLDTITHTLRRHESFAATLTFTVTIDRAG